MNQTRMLGASLLVYLPHLVEEALTRMYDDPLMVFALGPLATLSPRQAGYLVFQAMLLVTVATAYLVSLGGRWRTGVLLVLGLALVGEAHHLVRAAVTLHYNSGLATALPMPIVGYFILRACTRP